MFHQNLPFISRRISLIPSSRAFLSICTDISSQGCDKTFCNTLTFSQSLRMTWSTCMTLWSARVAHVVSDVQPDASTGVRPTLGPLPCPEIHLAYRAKARGLSRHPGQQDEQHRLHEQPRPPKPNLKATSNCPTSEQNALTGLWLRPHPLS